MKLSFAGVELYFDDLSRARKFYHEVLGLKISDESAGHHAKFEGGGSNGFVCVERKGSENYPSKDKAVLFFEVDDLKLAIEQVGAARFVHQELTRTASRPCWAVLHDPEGHNILLLER
jgi:predicted enzyme related to lactoylglutathione lyase